VKKERMERVDHEIQRAVAKIIDEDVKDPRMGFTTVTRVEVSPDLRSARVFVSIIGDRHAAAQTMKTLQGAARFVRGELGAAVKLRHTPELHFIEDRTTERAIALSTVLAKTHTE
jgi:ribosome-binding factor A